MSRCLSVALLACFLFSSSIANGEDFVPKILQFFPGKWKVTDGDGQDRGVVDWKLVAGDKAIAGKGTIPGDGENFHVAGWDPRQKAWTHVIFGESGYCDRFAITSLKGNTYHGTCLLALADGTTASGTSRNRIVDKDNFEVTNEANGEKTILRFERLK